MKKIIVVLFASILCIYNISVIKVSAEEMANVATITYYSTQNEEGFTDPFGTEEDDIGVLKAVEIIYYVIQGLIYLGKFVVYIGYQEPDYNAVVKWANENNYNISDLNYTITNVVVDNGCYSSYFPANPFCLLAND